MTEAQRRRPRGSGTITRKGGRYYPRLPRKGPLLGSCATYEEASRLLDATLAELRDGMALDVSGATLASLGASVLDDRELARTHRDVKTSRSLWATHVEPDPIGSLLVASVDRSDVVGWLGRMTRKSAQPGHRNGPTRRRLSRSTVQNALNLLRGVLRSAVDSGDLERNPAEGVRLPKGYGASGGDPWTYLLPDEQQRLIAVAGHIVAFAIGTGLRQAEQWALRVGDVDLGRGVVSVRRGKGDGATKSGRVRHVHMLGPASDAVRRQLRELPADQRRPSDRLWPSATGLARRGRPPEWRRWLAAAGLDSPEARHDGRHVRWHDLRHTCASALVSGQWGEAWPIAYVSQQLGHSTIAITERYAHLAPSAIRSLAIASQSGPTDRPTSRPTAGAGSVADGVLSAENHWEPPARVELATYGLRNRASAQRDQELVPSSWPEVGLRERAIGALAALASGDASAYRLAVEALAEVASTEEATGKRSTG